MQNKARSRDDQLVSQGPLRVAGRGGMWKVGSRELLLAAAVSKAGREEPRMPDFKLGSCVPARKDCSFGFSAGL